MNWDEAFEILQPLADADYIGGAWNDIRYHKCKALFTLAQNVKSGVIVELGTFRGLGAIALSLGATVPVHTIDDYKSKGDHLGVRYEIGDKTAFERNIERAHVAPNLHQCDVRQIARDWQAPVGLLVWDLGMAHRMIDDVKAWLPHLQTGGKVAVKDLETGEFGHERLYEIGLQKFYEDPLGCMYSAKKTASVMWVVNQPQYVEETKVSATSVLKHMPALDANVYMPQKREHAEWFIEATRIFVEALKELPDGEPVLWLDSDTYMVEPVPELFEMLEHFDMCLAHAPGHVTAPTIQRIPVAFPEFNIGVIAMRNNQQVRYFWQNVYTLQVENKKVYGNNDQAALRDALWLDCGLRYATLPNEYNCRFNFGAQVRDRVKILHGRPAMYLKAEASLAGDYEYIAKSINAGYQEGYQIAPRLWSPHVS